MFSTVNKDVLTMLMMSLARDTSALGSIEVEVEVEDGSWDSLFPIPMSPTANLRVQNTIFNDKSAID